MGAASKMSGSYHHEAACRRAHARIMSDIIREALAHAAHVQPEPAPPYWVAVREKCEQIISALQRGEDVQTARLGINEVFHKVRLASSRASARAAGNALQAADLASRGQALAAAEAVVAAAGSASWALGTGPAPAKAAEAVAWEGIACKLLRAIDFQMRG
jgi:hypothetical protein